MHSLIEELTAGGPVLTDGAWGTQLQARGLALGEFPDEWNLSHPKLVYEVALEYVRAGSRIILTNTFGSNRIRLAEAALANQLEEINRLGVAISRTAADGRALVFASMGPTGKMAFAGEVEPTTLHDIFGEQARALASAGADALVIETMSDLNEATIAVAAAKETGLPVIASMVFDAGKNRDRTMTGATPEQAAVALFQAGADVIGANCGQGIEGFASICARLKAATDRPIWIKANAGLPQVIEGRATYKTSPMEFSLGAQGLREAGATFIGGCCGTTPEFISELCNGRMLNA